jgi:hypothetical protein
MLQKALNPIEVILLLGEPTHWKDKFTKTSFPHIPFFACNKNL